MSNRHETSYTNKIKNNFYSLNIPAYIRGNKVAATTEQEKRDLEDRRRQRDELLVKRTDTHAAYAKAQKDLDDFQQKALDFRQANNVKNPNADERQLIAVVTRSVSSVRLTGPSHGIPDIDRRIAGHAIILTKRRDETMNAWNEAGKVIFKFGSLFKLTLRNMMRPRKSSKTWNSVYKLAATDEKPLVVDE